MDFGMLGFCPTKGPYAQVVEPDGSLSDTSFEERFAAMHIAASQDTRQCLTLLPKVTATERGKVKSHLEKLSPGEHWATPKHIYHRTLSGTPVLYEFTEEKPFAYGSHTQVWRLLKHTPTCTIARVYKAAMPSLELLLNTMSSRLKEQGWTGTKQELEARVKQITEQRTGDLYTNVFTELMKFARLQLEKEVKFLQKYGGEIPHLVAKPELIVKGEGGLGYIQEAYESTIYDLPRPLQQDSITLLFKTLLASIGTMHQHRLVYRDLNAGNVLVRGKKFFLSDFGAAMSMQHAVSHAIKHPEDALGIHTPPWVRVKDKEQLIKLAREGEDKKMELAELILQVDRFAIAALVFFVVTNRHPFQHTESGYVDADRCECKKEAPHDIRACHQQILSSQHPQTSATILKFLHSTADGSSTESDCGVESPHHSSDNVAT